MPRRVPPFIEALTASPPCPMAWRGRPWSGLPLFPFFSGRVSPPPGFTGSNGCAELCLHPNGQFLYASNRGHDSIAIYRVDAAQGTLSLIEHQTTAIETPRNFCLDPTGRYCLVANQSADTVVVFRVDVRSGQLVPTEHAVSVGRPVCVRFLDTPDR
ncbi:MAG: beta-propeller fold lactonase family protein [Planctomycetes bacterium]|nr:beta-propeller fold lactonase family protein [Planctomycetota bacterium]